MRAINLSGKTFGKLSVIRLLPLRKNKDRIWFCRCVCGNKAEVSTESLRSHHTQSCGCFKLFRMRTRNIRHGYTRPKQRPEYQIWAAMIQRCRNPKNVSFNYYGARGIHVCKRWHQFENFLADMGNRPQNLTLDRIDNNKGYSLKNCRWATCSQQRFNQRRQRAVV